MLVGREEHGRVLVQAIVVLFFLLSIGSLQVSCGRLLRGWSREGGLMLRQSWPVRWHRLRQLHAPQNQRRRQQMRANLLLRREGGCLLLLKVRVKEVAALFVELGPIPLGIVTVHFPRRERQRVLP